MTQPRTLFDSFLVMFVGLAISLMLIATIGQIGDKALTTLVDIGMFEVNPDWGATTDTVYTFQSFLFLCCFLPGLLGIIVFILSAVKRQRYDVGVEPPIDYSSQFGGR